MNRVTAALVGLGDGCGMLGDRRRAPGIGVGSVPGEVLAGATVGSRERYYGAILLGCALAWVWAARQSPIPVTLVRFLTVIFLLGAVGRIISILDEGWPQWFQVVLTRIEIVLPPVFFALTRHTDRAAFDRNGDWRGRSAAVKRSSARPRATGTDGVFAVSAAGRPVRAGRSGRRVRDLSEQSRIRVVLGSSR